MRSIYISDLRYQSGPLYIYSKLMLIFGCSYQICIFLVGPVKFTFILIDLGEYSALNIVYTHVSIVEDNMLPSKCLFGCVFRVPSHSFLSLLFSIYSSSPFTCISNDKYKFTLQASQAKAPQ